MCVHVCKCMCPRGQMFGRMYACVCAFVYKYGECVCVCVIHVRTLSHIETLVFGCMDVRVLARVCLRMYARLSVCVCVCVQKRQCTPDEAISKHASGR